MQKHRTFISSVLKIDLELNSILLATECRNIKPLSVGSWNWFKAKFHITGQGFKEHRTFISSLLKVFFGLNATFLHKECRNSSFLLIDFSPNSILQISEYRNTKPLLVRIKYWFWAKFSHKKLRNAGTSNFYQLDP